MTYYLVPVEMCEALVRVFEREYVQRTPDGELVQAFMRQVDRKTFETAVDPFPRHKELQETLRREKRDWIAANTNKLF